MNRLRLATMILAGTSASAIAAAPGSARAQSMDYAQVSIREQVIIRVQTMQQQSRPSPNALTASNKLLPQEAPVKWREKKAPRCVPLRSLAGISSLASDSIDLLLRGGQRLRAKLDDDCPALDFYRGFYVKPTEDGKMCADRDAIHSRSGAQCDISHFRALVPDR